MDILSEPNAFEPIFDTISSSEIDKPEELEPESERDSEYYFDTVVFKVCHYLIFDLCSPSFSPEPTAQKGRKYALSRS